MIEENLKHVREKILEACQKADRDPSEVTLISVSKTKPIDQLMEAYQAGSRDFGENKVQEIMDKYDAMPQDVKWHMIGHLQRNKVKYIIDKVCLIHSVDSFRLAQEISIQAQKKRVPANILIEVNVAGEESKFGVSTEDVLHLVEQSASLPNIKVCGLMTIAPFVENPEENRKYFRILKQISIDIGRKNIDNVNMEILSMGMTNDFQVAIEEGATMVRVGTGIFGERNYN